MLHATPSSIANCACLANAVALTLNYVPGQSIPTWQGSGAFGTCGQTVTLKLTCGTIGGPPPCLGFRLDVTFSNNCDNVTQQPPAMCSCPPINLLFTFSQNPGSCCNLVGQVGAWQWTITQ